MAADQPVTVTAGEAAKITLSGSDPEGATLKYEVVSPPTKGTLSGTTPALTYTTERTASGSDSFKFKVNDGAKDSGVATVSLTINKVNVNEPPVAADQPVTVTAGEAAKITLSGSDPEKQPLTYTVVEPPTKGKLSGTAPALTYTTERTASGSDSFKFKVNDGAKDSGVATVSLTINKVNVNEPPAAADQPVTVTAGEAAKITLSGSDPEGATLKYEVVSPPTKGTLSGTAPALTYKTERTASGSDSFKFKVNDGAKDSGVATVSITINKVNEPPVAADQPVTVTAGEAAKITLSGSDPEKQPLTYTVVEPPTKGKLSGTAPALTYATERTASGSDSFKFKVNDGAKDSGVATVSLTINKVNEPPVAADQPVTVTAGEAAKITLSGSDPEKQPLTYTVVEPPTKGKLSGTAPALTYTTERTASGSDSFKFKVNDGAKDSGVATVSLTINKVNEPPVAADQPVTVTAGEAAKITLSGSDPEKQSLTYTVVEPADERDAERDGAGADVHDGTDGQRERQFQVQGQRWGERLRRGDGESHDQQGERAAGGGGPTGDGDRGGGGEDHVERERSGGATLTYTVVEPPTKGTLSGTAPALTYKTERTASGSDSFKFKVNDGAKDSGVATVSITINKVNEPPVAADQPVTVTAGEAAKITLSGSDPEGATLKYEVVSQPTKGTLSGTAPALTYTTERTASGSDSFKFKVNDGAKDSGVATVSITINKVNEPPVAADQPVTVTAGEAAKITLSGSDPEGATLKYEVVSPPTKGTLSGTAPALTYTTERTASGSDSFKFKVNDGAKDSGVATVSITINKVNEPPVAADQPVTVTAGEAAKITLSGSDPEGATLKYEVVSPPTKGTLSGTAPALTYTTERTASGSDSFKFKVNDMTNNSAMATVSITINNPLVSVLASADQAFKVGKYGEADTYVKKALELDPGNGVAKALQGEINAAKEREQLDIRLAGLQKRFLGEKNKPKWLQVTAPSEVAEFPKQNLNQKVLDGYLKEVNDLKQSYGKAIGKDRQDLLRKLSDTINNWNQ